RFWLTAGLIVRSARRDKLTPANRLAQRAKVGFMRYEDASQAGAMTGDVVARDDTDHLAGNDFGPAIGNLITGSGTVSGATGTDMVGPGGHITAIAGAGGSDTSFDADGKL